MKKIKNDQNISQGDLSLLKLKETVLVYLKQSNN
jgi:hypothetical protein